jgi:hypothetical protein
VEGCFDLIWFVWFVVVCVVCCGLWRHVLTSCGLAGVNAGVYGGQFLTSLGVCIDQLRVWQV